MPDPYAPPPTFEPDSDPRAWLDDFRQGLGNLDLSPYPRTDRPSGRVPGLLGNLDSIRQAIAAGEDSPRSATGVVQRAPTDPTTAPSSTPAAPMSLSPDGADFIKRKEGWHGSGLDSVEGGTQTAFWGHKLQSGEDPKAMDPDKTFQADKARAEALVRQIAGDTPLSQSQFDGFVSFAYNSPAAFRNTSNNFFREMLSGGNVRGAANRMLLWDKASNAAGAKAAVPGLTSRRNAERNLVLNGDYDAP